MVDRICPDFDNIVVDDVVLPYRERPYKRFSFSDELLGGYEVIVVADSLPVGGGVCGDDLEGDRLVTLITRFPRCILAEVNTHRVFSRNSASSRARSVKTTIKDVMTNPYIPLFTVNRPGMSGVFLESEKKEKAKEAWLEIRDSCVYGELKMLLGDLMPVGGSISDIISEYPELIDMYYDKVYNAETPDPLALSIHKQDANRPIEAFMWHEAVITSSYWDNFIALRTDENTAQPAIVALAKLIEKALKVSVPKSTEVHLPFISEDDDFDKVSSFEDMRRVLMLSSTESAQISYRDKSNAEKSTARSSLGERLFAIKHLSPFEHVGFSSKHYVDFNDDVTEKDIDSLRGNFSPSWVQLRHVALREYDKEFNNDK